MSGSSAFKYSFGHFLKKFIPYLKILGPTISFQIYPFLIETMDEHGVIFSLKLHPPESKATDLTVIKADLVLFSSFLFN